MSEKTRCRFAAFAAGVLVTGWLAVPGTAAAQTNFESADAAARH